MTLTGFHVGRSWPGMGTPVEDACPCEKAPCGLAIPSGGCSQHAGTKTMRQGHDAGECPGSPSVVSTDVFDRDVECPEYMDTTAPSQLPADPYARSAYVAALFREEDR